MTQQYPITPPPELLQQWLTEFYGTLIAPGEACTDLANRAAHWGADQELKACCEYLVRCAQWEPEDVDELRAARRPNPPSLKDRALKGLAKMIENGHLAPDLAAEIRAVVEMAPDE